jgi:hypothetical protein
MRNNIERHLALPQEQKEARAEELFSQLAEFTAEHIVI